jgi:glycosyltransferase involved in cell wall biosynthesis
MPLMPSALMDFNLQNYELIISSESGPAKGIVPHPDAFHICYCHTPMRYLWDMYHEYLRKSNLFVRFFMKRLTPNLRLWDVVSANLVDVFIANSGYVAKRIMRYYNRESIVIHPPADIERFISAERRAKDYYLFFGQVTGYKRADIAIEACIKFKRKLIVAGSGVKMRDKKKYEKSGFIQFIGRISDNEAVRLFSEAKALLYPGIEDFGLVPVEANASGCPVIAYRGGGALATVKENVTGLFFDEQTPESLIEAIKKFEQNDYNYKDRQLFNDHVQQFSKIAFIKRFRDVIKKKERL